MPRRYAIWLVFVLALTAGCSASGQPADEPRRNASLSLPEYERTGAATSVETRVFWDRSKSWEDPGNRTGEITSHALAYRNSSGTDTVVVYTTPRKRYVGTDSVRSLPAPEMADLATRSVETPPLGDATGRSYRASLFGENVTVRTVTDAANGTTGHVTHIVGDDAIVVVVVVGDVDRTTVERVLEGVTLYGSPARVEREPPGE